MSNTNGNASFCFPISQEEISSSNQSFMEHNYCKTSDLKDNQLQSTVTIKGCTRRTSEEIKSKKHSLITNNSDTTSSNSIIKLRLQDFDVVDGTIAIPLELLTNLNFMETNKADENGKITNVHQTPSPSDNFWAKNVFSLPSACFSTKQTKRNDSCETYLAVEPDNGNAISINLEKHQETDDVPTKPSSQCLEVMDVNYDENIMENMDDIGQNEECPVNNRNAAYSNRLSSEHSSDVIENTPRDVLTEKRGNRKRRIAARKSKCSSLKPLVHSHTELVPFPPPPPHPTTSSQSNLFSTNDIQKQNQLPSSNSNLQSDSGSKTIEKDPKLRRKKYENTWPTKSIEEKVCRKFTRKFRINIFEDPVESLMKIDYETETNKFHYPRITIAELKEKFRKTESLRNLLENAVDQTVLNLIETAPEKLYKINQRTANNQKIAKNNSDSDSTDDGNEEETQQQIEQFLQEAKTDAEMKMKKLCSIYDNQMSRDDSFIGNHGDSSSHTSDDENTTNNNDGAEDKLITIFRNLKEAKISD